MANTFVTLQTIARQALPRLVENLVFPNLCYKDFSDAFQFLGDTIQVRKPTRLNAEDFSETSGVNYQDLEESTIPVTLDHIATVDAQASAIETAVNINDLNRVFIEPAAVALAEEDQRRGSGAVQGRTLRLRSSWALPPTLLRPSPVRGRC